MRNNILISLLLIISIIIMWIWVTFALPEPWAYKTNNDFLSMKSNYRESIEKKYSDKLSKLSESKIEILLVKVDELIKKYELDKNIDNSKRLKILALLYAFRDVVENTVNTSVDEDSTTKIEESNNDENSYNIVDTWVTSYYSDDSVISKPSEGKTFYWQDAHYTWNTPSYTDNNDGTITDNVTGLIWEQDMWDKMTFEEAFKKAESSDLGWYDDWRVSSIKELYSLIQFTGQVWWQKAITPFIDDDYFDQPLWDTSLWEREIDAQTWSSTQYVWKTMNSDDTVFGVNFVDGRIKWYPKYNPRTKESHTMYFRLVRWNSSYWENDFVDNWDNTITDNATSLIWMENDSSKWLDWEEALEYCEELTLSNYSDWRLPNTKELQSIVDYTRSPQTTNSAAIDPIFNISAITDPDWDTNYPFFWTSTTHLDWKDPEEWAAYVCFGECQWEMNWKLMDVHWAWAQRSDPKSWSTSAYPQYWWPQGDVRYVYNYVRCVRDDD